MRSPSGDGYHFVVQVRQILRRMRLAEYVCAQRMGQAIEMSHEIRTPLNAVLASVELLRGSMLPRKSSTDASTAFSGVRISWLI
ncbi:histidine kinase dimerization/phospho-acceptor domain-containing protein, partial [Chromobacterium phragmitis]